MPHVLIKLLSGRSADQKARIAEAVTQALTATAGCDADAVSISMEDIAAADWTETVYRRDIESRPDLVVRPPGYEPS